MTLRLAITQGPLQGKTLDFCPKSTVRIGRILRGNTCAIKDSGVSSKHFSIEPDHGKWLLRDLDSSNGTFLNGKSIDPAVSVELSDGDCIKIGESTSISVSITVSDDKGMVRRNPRRGDSAAENQSNENVEVSERPIGTRQRSRRLKKDNVSVSGLVLEKIPENLEVDLGEVKAVPDKLTRPRTQRGKKKQLESVGEDSEASVEEDNDCSVAERSDGVGIAVDVVKVKVEVDAPKCPRTQRGKKKQQESVEKYSEADVRVDAMEERIYKPNRRGVQRGKNSQRESVQVDSEADVRANVSEDRIEDDNDCTVAESFCGVDSKEVDLEKMTLGEWFDSLEVDLPKQIIEATEEIIKGLRLKAKMVHEYVVQQKNGKETVV